MDKLIQSVSSLGFSKIGSIILDTKQEPNFLLTTKYNEFGWVYLWLEVCITEAKIVYVGKAGKTLHERCRQHVGGFKGGSTTGSAHAARISAGIKNGKRYELWSKKSDIVTLFGEQNISMAEVEEKAFIQKFQPIWNKC